MLSSKLENFKSEHTSKFLKIIKTERGLRVEKLNIKIKYEYLRKSLLENEKKERSLTI